MANLMNINQWNGLPASGSIGNWSAPYWPDLRYYTQDPWNAQSLVWECKSDQVGTQGDGGFNYPNVIVDPTKLYRFSIWINRTVTGSLGRCYMGIYGYTSGGSNIGIVRLSSGATDTNAYCYVSAEPPTQSELPTGVWILAVYHIYPHTHGGTSNHSDSGLYKVDGTRMTPGSTSADHKFLSNNGLVTPRCYLFYAAASVAVQNFLYPRFEMCDGTEPTVQQLLRNQRFYTTMSIGGSILNIECRDIVSN